MNEINKNNFKKKIKLILSFLIIKKWEEYFNLFENLKNYI